MPTLEQAEKALDFLRETSPKVAPFAKQARLKTHMLKYTEALLIKAMDNSSTPVSVRKECARADDKYKEALEEDAEAYAEWISLQEQRETARNAISLYQTQTKDRL